jgi:hypothetical protein
MQDHGYDQSVIDETRISWSDAIERLDLDLKGFEADFTLLEQGKDQAGEILDESELSRHYGDMYLRWRKDGAPSNLCLSLVFAKALEVQEQTTEEELLIAAALISMIPLKNAFHSNAHLRDVTTTLFMLCQWMYDAQSKRNTQVSDLPDLEAEDFAALITSGFIHDFLHDGKGNSPSGTHVPMLLESKAANEAIALLKAADIRLTHSQEQMITLSVLSTDVTADARGYSPSRYVHNNYDMHFKGKAPSQWDIDALKAFRNGPKMCLAAMLLEEADLFTSAGLNYDYARFSTVILGTENDRLETDASTLHGFLEMICGGLLTTPAGKALLTKTHLEILNEAGKDAAQKVDFKSESWIKPYLK